MELLKKKKKKDLGIWIGDSSAARSLHSAVVVCIPYGGEGEGESQCVIAPGVLTDRSSGDPRSQQSVYSVHGIQDGGHPVV